MKPAEVSLPSDTEVRVVRRFDAPASLLWRAYTEPALMRQWLLGPPGWTMPVCEMDVRVGGKFRWRWRSDEDGSEFGFHGEFKALTLHTRIVHTEFFDPGDLDTDMGKGTLITVTFEENDGATTMTSLMEYASKRDRDAALSTGMTDGMEMSYAQLDTLLTSTASDGAFPQ